MTNRSEADFLRIGSEVALTLSSIAFGATDEETRTRTTIAARKAFDTIARLRWRIELTDTHIVLTKPPSTAKY
jgi:hypothetical protein